MNQLAGVNAKQMNCILLNATSSSDFISMPQWTTFDEETSSALHSRLPEESVVEHSDSSALDYALSCRQTLVAVLPCRGFGQAGLAVFRWNAVPATPRVRPELTSVPAPTGRTRTSGFLGLSDEPIFEDEEEQKKSWWKRFWEG